MDDRYIYLFFSLALLVLWVLMVLCRKDLFQKMFLASLMGGAIGLMGEFWFIRDYWRPPTVTWFRFFSLEDILFCFASSGIAAGIYDLCFRRTDVKTKPIRLTTGLLMLILTIVGMFIFSTWLGYNSMAVGYGLAVFLLLWIWLLRQDLIVASLWSGLLLMLSVLPLYWATFLWLAPGYWTRYGSLTNTWMNSPILAIPVSELLWYLLWGCLPGSFFNMVLGTERRRLQP